MPNNRDLILEEGNFDQILAVILAAPERVTQYELVRLALAAGLDDVTARLLVKTAVDVTKTKMKRNVHKHAQTMLNLIDMG